MFTVSKIINALIKKNISISVAESCTGGLISHTLAKHIGVSKIFKCGVYLCENKSKLQNTENQT